MHLHIFRVQFVTFDSGQPKSRLRSHTTQPNGDSDFTLALTLLWIFFFGGTNPLREGRHFNRNWNWNWNLGLGEVETVN